MPIHNKNSILFGFDVQSVQISSYFPNISVNIKSRRLRFYVILFDEMKDGVMFHLFFCFWTYDGKLEFCPFRSLFPSQRHCEKLIDDPYIEFYSVQGRRTFFFKVVDVKIKN